MKLSSSPSVSSSTSTSSTTTSFSGIFPSTKGCLSFVLRTILCSSKLPTHPSDHLNETHPIQYQTHQSMKPQNLDDPATPPNLVARLMGLDEFPSITRSESTKSSGSFELEDDDFFVINFDSCGKNRKPGLRKEKPEMGGSRNDRRRRSGRAAKEKGRRPSYKISDSSNEVLVLEMDNCGGGKRVRDRRRKKDKCLEGAKVEIESESENSSPVSVLDHSLFISDHEVPISEEDTRNRSSSPRRKLVSELSNLKPPTSNSNDKTRPKGDDQTPTEATKGKQPGPRRKGRRRHQNKEIVVKQVWRLAEVEAAEYEWKCKGGLTRNLKNWEDEIGVELGLLIVDQLLDEAVQQLI